MKARAICLTAEFTDCFGTVCLAMTEGLPDVTLNTFTALSVNEVKGLGGAESTPGIPTPHADPVFNTGLRHSLLADFSE